jgi:transcriptional regulator with XRE-family HTH domain
MTDSDTTGTALLVPGRKGVKARSTATSSRSAAQPAPIGPEIRDLRRAREMTLPELSRLSGCSTGFLSQVERGGSSPSVEALRRIASALGVNIGWFFRNEEAEDPVERDIVVRAGKRRSLGSKSGLSDELLSPNLRGALELLLCRFPPGATSGEEAYTHRGEEAGIVVEGQLELTVENRTFTLNTGDSFSFASTLPHRYRNPGAVEAVVIWAMTPPSY